MISDQEVEKAFDALREITRIIQEAEEEAGYYKNKKEQAYCQAFLEYSGTVAERECKAKLDSVYIDMSDKLVKAEARLKWIKALSLDSDKKIEAWRTSQSNLRSMSRVG